MKIRRIDHVGIIVEDLPAAKAFFLELGLEVQGEGGLEGELLDRVAALDNAKTEMVIMSTPDQQVSLELAKFIRPTDHQGIQQPAANTLGIRHIAFVVDDIEAVVAKLKDRGVEVFSDIQNYQNVYKLCYIRGPEGIILELAEELKSG